MKRRLKRGLDIAMTLALPCMMAYELIGEAAHEVLGLCLVGAFALHHALNGGWHRSLFRGPYTARRTALTVVDGLMTLIFASQAVCGIMMAKHVLPMLPHVGRTSFSRVLHLLGAYWGFALCGLHAGMHMSGAFDRLLARRRAMPLLAAGVVAAYGAFAFIRRGYPGYMLLREQFVFFDYEEPLALFLLDNAAMIAMFMALGCLAARLLQGIDRGRRVKPSH